MAYISIEVPSGAIGDIEAALLRCGMGRLDSAELAEFIVTSGGPIRFRRSKLARYGVEPVALVKELQSVGLQVRWTGAPASAA